MKKRVLSFALVLALVLMFVPSLSPVALASGEVSITGLDTVWDIQEAIQDAIDDLDGVPGTVTVTGTKEGVAETLHLDIPPGVVVDWQAVYSGSVGGSHDDGWVPHVLLETTNLGGLNVTDGSITNDALNAWTILSQDGGPIEVSGGAVTVKGTQGIGIIAFNKGSITISGGTVTATDDMSIAIHTSSGENVMISGGTVTALGNNSSAITTYSNENSPTGGSITVSGGTVTATGDMSSAINTSGGGDIMISGGMVTVSGQHSSTVYTNGNEDSPIGGIITVSSGTVTATGDMSSAINTSGGGNITISGGTVTASGQHSSAVNTHGSEDSPISGSITVSSGTVMATGDMSSAINTSEGGGITVAGGTVTNTGENGTTIHVQDGSVTVSGGTVKIEGGRTDEGANLAIVGSGDSVVTVSGGVVEAAGVRSEAILLNGGGDFIMSGGEVIASGEGSLAIWSREDDNPGGGGDIIISGGDVTSTGRIAIIADGGNVTISSSKLTSAYGPALIAIGGAVTVNSGEVTSAGDGVYAILTTSGGKAVINSGTVRSTGKKTEFPPAAILVAPDSELEINGGMVEATDSSGSVIRNWGTVTINRDATLKIANYLYNSGTIYNYGTLINSGAIGEDDWAEGDCIIYNYGTLINTGTITGDVFSTTVDVTAVFDAETGTARAEVADSAVAEAVGLAGQAAKAAAVTINAVPPEDVDIEDITAYEAVISAAAFKGIAETVDTLSIITPIAQISLDSAAIVAAGDGAVVITSARETGGERPEYSFTVTVGGQTVSAPGTAQIVIPYTLAAGENPNAVFAQHPAGDGTLRLVRGHYDAALNSVVLTTTDYARLVINYNLVPFDDVSANSAYYSAVTFLSARGITRGYESENMFAPEVGMTRAMVLVMLMRAYGIEPNANDDLSGVTYFEDATASWNRDYLAKARMLGITQGTSETTFSPDQILKEWELEALINRTLRALGESYRDMGDYANTPDVDRGYSSLVLYEYLTR